MNDDTPPIDCAEGIFIGCSPTIERIEELARERGFRGLVNANTEGEPAELLSPNFEATWAHAFDLEHARASVDSEAPSSSSVGEFLSALEAIERPVYVHSRRGRRATALLAIHLGRSRSLTGAEALGWAMRRGLPELPARMRVLVEHELDAGGGPDGEAAAPGDQPLVTERTTSSFRT